MVNRFSEPTRFLIFWGFVTLFAVAGVTIEMNLEKTISSELGATVTFHREPMVLMKEEEMDWTGQPLVHQVIQRKGTVLSVRSYIHQVVEGDSSKLKAISF